MRGWTWMVLAAAMAAPAQAETASLEAAIRAGNQAAVAAALDAGASADAALPGGLMTPLALAVTLGSTDIAALLLDRGASVDRPGALGMTPLAIAVHSCRAGPETVKLLVAAGAEIDARAPGGLTPLLAAAQKGRDDLVALLVASGADATAVDVFGDGMLNYAIYDRDPGRVHVALAAGAGTAQMDRLFLTRGYRTAVWPGPARCDSAS